MAESGEQPRRVFISHAHHDNAFVERLARDIEDAGLECWLDLWELNVGDSLTKRIESGITAADWLVLVLSCSSVQSQWVQHELSMALVRELAQRAVFILPVVIDECEIPLSLRDKFYADFRKDYSDGLRSLTTRLRDLAPEERRTLRRLTRYCGQVDEYLPMFAALFRITISAGIPILDALEWISEELPNPIATEIAALREALYKPDDIGVAAFRRMRQRVPTKRMQLFSAAACVGCHTGALDTLITSMELTAVAPGTMIWEHDRKRPWVNRNE